MSDVVVVGAGPVGLWVAAELKLNGVDVEVLEAASARDPRSRAVGMSAGTVETLATRGIAQRFIDAGVPIGTVHFGASSTRLQLDVLGIRHPFSLCIPQAATESLLEDYCTQLGVPIRHGQEVIGLDQDDESVVLRTTDIAGFSSEFVVPWVIGCDGTRSVTRRAAGIEFPGSDGTHTGWLADVQVEREPAGPLGCVTANGSCLMQAIGDGLYRIAGMDTATMHLPPEHPPTLDQVRNWAVEAFGDDYGMHSPLWISRYGNATRLADNYRKGRVLVAGDAAHQFFPAGGQGMNTGIQDATNLGWKLAATISGDAAAGLLDTYNDERRFAATEIIRNTNAQLALFSARIPSEIALREVFSEAIAHPDINARWAHRVTGFADPVPIDSRYHGHELLGTRVTHLVLDNNPDTLHTMMAANRFLLIDLETDRRRGSGDALAVAHPRLDIYRGPVEIMHPKWNNVAAVLVRPDARVAWVGPIGHSPADLRSGVEQAMATWIADHTATGTVDSASAAHT
ncbi:FAD-dependent monooxygenase [Nocardia sp. NPDC005998]|uniref:FAD-dependent monooxygenase n=1 Tax=Nocardia sp. NPDC005998 TaxID=3156894 RepID=UPI0033A637F9